MKTIKDIEKIIDWYAGSYGDATIVNLMDAKSKLVTLCYYLATEVAEARKQSVMTTVFRKYDHHNTKSRLIEEGYTVGLAESKSIEETKNQLVAEAEAESLATHYKLVLDYASRIADDITQRISVLKNERC